LAEKVRSHASASIDRAAQEFDQASSIGGTVSSLRQSGSQNRNAHLHHHHLLHHLLPPSSFIIIFIFFLFLGNSHPIEEQTLPM
jgi:hypothetical protein